MLFVINCFCSTELPNHPTNTQLSNLPLNQSSPFGLLLAGDCSAMHDLLRNQLFNNRQWKPQEFFANKLLASSRRTATSLSLPLLFDFRLLMLPVWVVSVGGWVLRWPVDHCTGI